MSKHSLIPTIPAQLSIALHLRIASSLNHGLDNESPDYLSDYPPLVARSGLPVIAPVAQ